MFFKRILALPQFSYVGAWPLLGWIAVGGGTIFATLCFLTTPYMAAATVSYLLMVCGFYFRRMVKRHAAFMLTAITLDLLIVLVLEFQRSAIKTALEFSLTLLQQAHIGASLIAVLFYFPVMGIGLWLLTHRDHRNPTLRSLHIKLALTAFFFRSVGFILMFSLLGRALTS